MSTINISLRKPCNQKWNDFEKKDGKGYCAVCEKHVTDFTKYSDKQLVDFFLVDKGNTCGRFRPGQLKTYQIEKDQNRFSKIAALFAAGIIAITQAPEVKAQTTKTEQVEQNHVASNTQEKEISAFVIIGTVKSDDEVLPGVNVVIKGTTDGTVTDENGNFRIVSNTSADETTLVFSFIGFETAEKTVSRAQALTDAGHINMEMDMDVLGGEIVCVTGGFRGFLYRITHPFRNW